MVEKISNNNYCYRASYIDKNTGKRIRPYKSGFRTKREAERAEFILLNSVEEKGETTITLYEVANEVDITKQRTLKYNSAQNSRTDFLLHIKPYFRNKPMNKISKKECKDFAEKIACLDLSSKSKNDILHLFKSFFIYAQDIYDLNYNPSTIIKPLKKTYDEEQVGEVWTVEEFNEFISYFDLSNPKEHRWALLFVVAFWTGVRRGELLALTFNDIDFNNKTISISKSVLQNVNKQNFVIDLPKTRSSIRKITLDDKTLEFLIEELELQKVNKDFHMGKFIFSRENNPTRPFATTTIDNRKDRIINKANLKRIRFHDFRHSHASILIMIKVDIATVSARLGHATVDMTLRIYTHFMPSAERYAVETINKIR